MGHETLHRRDVTALHARRTRFGREAARERLAHLERMAVRPIASIPVLRSYHDLLLFLAAHPDDAVVLARVESELSRVAATVRARVERSGPIDALESTGIAGSEVVSSFSYDLMRWLVRRFPKDVEIAWEGGSGGDALDDLLPLLVTSPETDGLLGEGPTAEEWMQLAKSGAHESDLRRLLAMLGRLGCPPALLDTIVERLDVPIRWRLARPRASLTHLRFPALGDPYFQTRPLRRKVSLRDAIRRPAPIATSLPTATARKVIDVARCALAFRTRETDPVTYSHPADVHAFHLDRGVDVFLFGMQPERRLPIESFIGFVAARNRVPVAYGGGWTFLDRLEIGINVFEQFRGGESGHVFGEILRTYTGLFRPRYVDVDPYQVGIGNPDGIRSGAFWFYYRLGFRPVGGDERALARAEWRRIGEDRRYRTRAAVLRRLAGTPLRLVLDAGAKSVPHLGAIARGVTRDVGARRGGDRVRAEREAWRELSRSLPIRDADTWSSAERAGARRFGVLAAALPDLARWNAREREGLAAILRARGSASELDYIRLAREHPRFGASLRALAERSETDG